MCRQSLIAGRCHALSLTSMGRVLMCRAVLSACRNARQLRRGKRLQVEAQLAEARATCQGLQASQGRKKGSLVFRLIRGGLSILATALALQQVWAPQLQRIPPSMPPELSLLLMPVADGALQAAWRSPAAFERCLVTQPLCCEHRLLRR